MLSLTFECNNHVVSIFSQQKHITVEIEPCEFLKIFLRFWSSESLCLIYFSYKKCVGKVQASLVPSDAK